MSRIGKAPIELPENVMVSVKNNNEISVKGNYGQLTRAFAGNINISVQDRKVLITPNNNQIITRALWGTARSVINNMVIGVSQLYKKELEIIGVGYRANLKGQCLTLSLGKSHNTKIIVPSDIKVEVLKQNIVVLTAIDKEKLGTFASKIIKQRKPEPYKGKGIKFLSQKIVRKENKKSTK